MKLIIPVFLYLMMIDYTIGVKNDISWTRAMKYELLKMYYTTSPTEIMHHGDRIKAEWDRKFPQYREKISADELRQYAIKLIKKLCHDETDKSAHLPVGFNENVLRIFFQTEKTSRYYGKEMRAKWNHEFPYFTVEENSLNLNKIATDLLDKLHEGKKDKRQKFPWTLSLDRAVMEINQKVPSNSEKRYEKMKALWDEKLPQFKDNITVGSLRLRAQKLIKEINETSEKSKREWNENLNAELLYIHHHTHPGSRYHCDKMHHCWTQLHPELKQHTPKRLSDRVSYLNRNGYKSSDEVKKKAELKIKEVFPDGLKFKGKNILNVADQLTNLYMVNYSEPRIEPFHSQHDMPSSSRSRNHLAYMKDYLRHHKLYVSESRGAKGKQVSNQSNEISSSGLKNKEVVENYSYQSIDVNQLSSQHPEIRPVPDTNMYQHDPSTSRRTRNFDLNQDPIDEHEQSDSSNSHRNNDRPHL